MTKFLKRLIVLFPGLLLFFARGGETGKQTLEYWCRIETAAGRGRNAHISFEWTRLVESCDSGSPELPWYLIAGRMSGSKLSFSDKISKKPAFKAEVEGFRSRTRLYCRSRRNLRIQSAGRGANC